MPLVDCGIPRCRVCTHVRGLVDHFVNHDVDLLIALETEDLRLVSSDFSKPLPHPGVTLLFWIDSRCSRILLFNRVTPGSCHAVAAVRTIWSCCNAFHRRCSYHWHYPVRIAFLVCPEGQTSGHVIGTVHPVNFRCFSPVICRAHNSVLLRDCCNISRCTCINA